MEDVLPNMITAEANLAAEELGKIYNDYFLPVEQAGETLEEISPCPDMLIIPSD